MGVARTCLDLNRGVARMAWRRSRERPSGAFGAAVSMILGQCWQLVDDVLSTHAKLFPDGGSELPARRSILPADAFSARA